MTIFVFFKGTSHEEGEKDRPTLTTRPNAVNSTLTGVVTSAAGVRTNERGCSSEDRGGCEHVCSQSAEPDSIRCLCYRGFRLDADGKSCIGMSVVILRPSSSLSLLTATIQSIHILLFFMNTESTWLFCRRRRMCHCQRWM